MSKRTTRATKPATKTSKPKPIRKEAKPQCKFAVGDLVRINKPNLREIQFQVVVRSVLGPNLVKVEYYDDSIGGNVLAEMHTKYLTRLTTEQVLGL